MRHSVLTINLIQSRVKLSCPQGSREQGNEVSTLVGQIVARRVRGGNTKAMNGTWGIDDFVY